MFNGSIISNIKNEFKTVKEAINEHKLVALKHMEKAGEALCRQDDEACDLYMDMHRNRWRKIHKLRRLLPERERV